MKEFLLINYSFTPAKETIELIKQFAYTFRPIMVDGERIPFFLN